MISQLRSNIILYTQRAQAKDYKLSSGYFTRAWAKLQKLIAVESHFKRLFFLIFAFYSILSGLFPIKRRENHATYEYSNISTTQLYLTFPLAPLQLSRNDDYKSLGWHTENEYHGACLPRRRVLWLLRKWKYDISKEYRTSRKCEVAYKREKRRTDGRTDEATENSSIIQRSYVGWVTHTLQLHHFSE